MNAPASSASHLKKISDIARLINAGSDLNALLERIVYAICRHSEWAACAIMRIDAEAGYSVLVQRFDPQAPGPGRKPLADKWKLAGSPAAKVALTGETVIIPDAQRAKDFPGYKKDAVVRDYHTVVILPLSVCDSAGRALILAVQSRQVVTVAKAELAFLKTVSDLAAIAVEKSLRLQAEHAANARLRQTTAAHTQLMEKILCGDSMAAVCKNAGKLLRHPWLVIDLVTRAVYAGGGSPLKNLSAKRWHELIHGEANWRLFDAVRGAQSAQFREPAEVELQHGEYGETPVALSAFIEPLQVDGETMGGLLLAPGESVFDEFDRLTAETVVLALSVQLMRGHLRFQTEASSRMDVLSRLFNGDWRTTEGFAARARDLGIDISAPARLIGFAYAEAGAGLGLEYAHRCLSGLVARLFAGAVTAQQGGEIMALLPAGEKHEQQWDGLKQRLLEEAKRALGTSSIIFCGRVCRALEEYAPARRECSRILKLAQTFNRVGWVTAADFDSAAVLLSVAENRVVGQFLDEKIIPIADYDQAHGAKYLATLKAFVEAEGRFEPCAKTLGIHVSTLRYRLQRIADLFGIAAGDAEARFDLSLAIKLYDLAAVADAQ